MREVLTFLRQTCRVAFVVLALSSIVILSAQTSQPAKQVKPGRSQRAAAGQNKPDPAPPINITVTTPDKSTAEKQEERKRAERQDAINERIVKFTFWLVVVGAAEAVGTVLAFLVAIRAANAAKDSADSAKAAVEKAQLTVDLFEGQNAIMSTQSAIMDGQAAAAREQAGHMLAGLALTREAVEIARESVAVSEKALISVQRPFVMQKRTDIGQLVDLEGKWSGWAFYGIYENMGNTPAKKVSVATWIVRHNSGEDHLVFEEMDRRALGFSRNVGPRAEFQTKPVTITAEEGMQVFGNS